MQVKEGAKIRRAFRRITCWKVVVLDSENCMWTGPYYGCDSYVEGKIMKSDKRIEVKYNLVDHGLHTYADESDAGECFNIMSKYNLHRYRLVYCKIPRFSRYIEGFGNDMARCYVSEQLKVIKFV